MALTDAQRDRVEMWTGPLDLDDHSRIEDGIERYSHPELAALWWLQRKLSEMIQQPRELRLEGDMRVNWSGSVEEMRRQITRLHHFIVSQALPLNREAERLLASTEATDVVTATKYTSLNPRP